MDMGTMRRPVAVCVSLLLTSCTNGGAERTAPASPRPNAIESNGWLITSLPPDCHGIDEPFPEGEVTFAKEGAVYTVREDGVARCLFGDVESHSLSWGALGERALVDGKALSDGSTSPVPIEVRQETWSRPTGKAVIYISHDLEQLLKVELGDKKPRDISFLSEHHDVAYHPAGTHIAVSGIDDAGNYGLYIATNEGREIQLIARGESAGYIDQLSFSHGGRKLFFTADHGSEIHLHQLSLVDGTRSGSMEDALLDVRLKTLVTTTRGINSLVISPFDGAIAYESRCKIHLMADHRGGNAEPVRLPGDRPVRPVGWMPDGKLAYLEFEKRCDETAGDLHLLDPSTTEVEQIVQDVYAAAVRVALPPPPRPPERASGVVA